MYLYIERCDCELVTAYPYNEFPTQKLLSDIRYMIEQLEDTVLPELDILEQAITNVTTGNHASYVMITSMMRKTHMINFDELFKNHQATRVDCGPLSIITYKKPDSFEHGLRYIFDNELSTLTITGDWLKAVAVNVNNMGSPDRLYESAYEPHVDVCRYGDYKLDFDIGYLNSKIVTKDKSNGYEFLDFDEVE